MYIRYQVVENGEYMGKGIFQAMHHFMYPEEMTHHIKLFADLPIPNIDFNQYLFTESYFTEKGNKFFEERINMIQDYLEESNSTYAIEKVILEKISNQEAILYEDDYQILLNLQEQEVECEDELIW